MLRDTLEYDWRTNVSVVQSAHDALINYPRRFTVRARSVTVNPSVSTTTVKVDGVCVTWNGTLVESVPTSVEDENV